MHFFMLSHSNRASSTIFFSGTVLSPLKAPSAVIIRLHLASFILVDNAVAEKPPKTTE